VPLTGLQEKGRVLIEASQGPSQDPFGASLAPPKCGPAQGHDGRAAKPLKKNPASPLTASLSGKSPRDGTL